MIELQPEILQAIQQIGTGIFIFLFVSAVVKLLRGVFRTLTDGYNVWQNRRTICLLERISADINGIGLKILEIHACMMAKAGEEKLKKRDKS